jgi:O-antigen/teichoic acid export membrane protein
MDEKRAAGVGLLPRPSPVETTPEEPVSSTADVAPTQQHIRGSSLLLGGRFVSLALALVTETALVRLLSKTDYGALAFALSVVAIGGTAAALGLDKSAGRFVPIYEEEGRSDRVMSSIATMTAAMLLAGLALMVPLLVLGDRLPEELVGRGETLVLVLFVAALIPLSALSSLAVALLTIFIPPRALLFQRYVFAPGIKLLAIGAALVLSDSVELVAVAYVFSAAAALALYSATLVRILWRRRLLSQVRPRLMAHTAREIIPFTLPLMSTDVVFVLRTSLLIVALQAISGSIASAEYRAVVPLAQQNTLVLDTFAFLFVPLAARLYARRDRAGVHDLYWRSAVWVAVMNFPVFAATFALAGPITILLYGEQYASSAPVLAVLALGFYANAALGFNGITLRVYGRVRFLVVAEAMSVVVGVALGLVLIAYAGALGAAFSFLATMLLQNVLYQFGMYRIGLVKRSDTRVIRTYAGIVVCALGLFALQSATGMPLIVGLGIAFWLWIAIIYVNRDHLQIAETFPELAIADPRRWFRGRAG